MEEENKSIWGKWTKNKPLNVLSNTRYFLLLLIFKDKNVKSMEKNVNLSLRLPKLPKIVVIQQVLRSSNSFSFDKFFIKYFCFSKQKTKNKAKDMKCYNQ